MSHRLTEHALQESRLFGMRRLSLWQPLTWLARGWRDFMACPWPGLLHGVLMAGFGWVLLWLADHQFWLVAGAFSGFLLVAPILATGLLAISRQLARGGTPGVSTAAAAWHPKDRRLVVFGGCLALAGTGWVLTSASLIDSMAPGLVDTPEDFVRNVVLAKTGVLFEMWLGLGALLAAPVFASTVVTVALLLDRPVSVLAAVLTSWRVVMEHPVPMALWAVLIMGLTLLGMALMLLGLVLTVPWIAHASWHAYQDTVAASGPAERN